MGSTVWFGGWVWQVSFHKNSATRRRREDVEVSKLLSSKTGLIGVVHSLAWRFGLAGFVFKIVTLQKIGINNVPSEK